MLDTQILMGCKCRKKCKKQKRRVPAKQPSRNCSVESKEGKSKSASSIPDNDTDNTSLYSHRLSKFLKRSRLKKTSRNVISVRCFAEVRENYFKYLQRTVNENYQEYFQKDLEFDFLENLSLELEQQPLMACMQAEIYQKLMTELICDIKNCTKEKKLHFGIKGMLGENSEDVPCTVKIEDNRDADDGAVVSSNLSVNVPADTPYLRIPTICTNRFSDENYEVNEYDNDNDSRSPNSYINSDQYIPQATGENFSEVHDSYTYPSESLQSGYDSQPTQNCNSYSQEFGKDVYSHNQKTPHQDNDKTSNDININDHDENIDLPENNVNSSNDNSNNSAENAINDHLNVETDVEKNEASDFDCQAEMRSTERVDPILAARSQLKKSIDKALDQVYKVNVKRNEDKERAEIAHILEGDDSLDDRLCEAFGFDSESENNDIASKAVGHCEVKKEVPSSEEFRFGGIKTASPLSDRVQKMRQIFGVEDDEYDEEDIEDKEEEKNVKAVVPRAIIANKKPVPEKVNPRTNGSIWKHEKVIQQYKYSRLSMEMSDNMLLRNRDTFLELFGEDSDDENEVENSCEENYINSCVERISSWVVKYLMPYYHQKRILGRPVFKSLAHHVSRLIVDKIQYPDEWSVKYFVGHFFPHKKVYFTEEDVFCTAID